MSLPFPIAATQTDAKSPIDQQLMDALRLNQEFLDSQIGGASAGGILNFRVNGRLSRIKALLALGGGQNLDGGIISNAVSFSAAKLYLEKGGTSGTLEVDVLRHKELQHAIEKVTSQFSGVTQAVGRLGSSLNTQAVSQATPQIATQLITKPKSSASVFSIADIGNNDFLYTFTGIAQLDADYEIGDSIQFSGCTNAANDGEFIIKQVNYDGLPSIVINNASGVEQVGAAGTGVLSLYEFTYLALIDDDIVSGEQIIMAGHTVGGNNGTFTIYKTNQAGNNIWLKYAGGSAQAGVAGTADCTRWVYVFSVLPDITQYIVGEKAEFAGHSSANNNGKFVIRRVALAAGNNIYVSNVNGVSQGGAAGTGNTLRWLYTMATDPAADINVGDKIIFSGHSSGLNDGTFTVQFVKRFTVNNVEIYNEIGVTQAGIAGIYETTLRVVWFKEDFSADFLTGTSKVILEGLKTVTGDIVPEYDVVEVNRGGFANYNVVIEAEKILEQAVTSGRVARELRTIFINRPKLTVAQDNVIRNLQKDTGATFVAGGVDADTILTLNIISVPEGLPSTMVLSLL